MSNHSLSFSYPTSRLGQSCASVSNQDVGPIFTGPKYGQQLHFADSSVLSVDFATWNEVYRFRAIARLIRKEHHVQLVSSALGIGGKSCGDTCSTILSFLATGDKQGLLQSHFDSCLLFVILVFETQLIVFHRPLPPREWKTCYFYIT